MAPFYEEDSPAKIDYRKKGTLIPTSLLEDLGLVANQQFVLFVDKINAGSEDRVDLHGCKRPPPLS